MGTDEYTHQRESIYSYDFSSRIGTVPGSHRNAMTHMTANFKSIKRRLLHNEKKIIDKYCMSQLEFVFGSKLCISRFYHLLTDVDNMYIKGDIGELATSIHDLYSWVERIYDDSSDYDSSDDDKCV